MDKEEYKGQFTILPWCMGRIGLDIAEVAMLMLICGLENSGKACTVSNKWISVRFNISSRKIDRVLSHLEELEYIERKTYSDNGALRKRKLISTEKGRAALNWLSENCGSDEPEASFEDFWLLG